MWKCAILHKFHRPWLCGILNFPTFHKKCDLAGSFKIKYISKNSSPKGFSWCSKRKSEFSSDYPYFHAKALKSGRKNGCRNTFMNILWSLSAKVVLIFNAICFWYVQSFGSHWQEEEQTVKPTSVKRRRKANTTVDSDSDE